MKKAFLQILSSTNYPNVIKKIAAFGIFAIILIVAIITGFFFAV